MRSSLALLFLTGCFTPMADPLVVDKLSLQNAYTEYDDIVLTPLTWGDLTCPDGAPSTVYMVYREGLEAAAPVVIVFHSGSFDYVLAPTVDAPLTGPHYQEEDRLSSGWASRKVFETMGLVAGDDLDENLGTIPAALANAGTIAFYPANCWGDLWHNESGYEPNIEGEGFERNGRALAWAVTAMFSADEATQGLWRSTLGFEPPIEIDASSVGLIGLGEGGRAIPELLRRAQFVPSQAGSSSVMPTVSGVAIDSTMDNLYPVYVDETTYGPEVAGIERIFPDAEGGDIGKYSLQRWVTERGVPGSVTVLWSSLDPEVPASTLQGIVSLSDGNTVIATDVASAGHVFSNADPVRATEIVNRVLGR